MSDKIDIREHVEAICEAFGFESRNVAHIDLWPAKAKVKVFKLNENGSKYVDLEEGSDQYGFAASEEFEFEVIT